MVIESFGRRNARVNTRICPEPCLLLEAMELVYSFVNQSAPEQLAGTGEFAIPLADVTAIRDAACGDLDRGSDIVQFFFHPISSNRVSRGHGRELCIASHILYGNLTSPAPDPDCLAQSLLDYWNAIQRPYTVAEMDSHCLSIDTAAPGQQTPLSRELSKLPVSAEAQNQLMDVIYNYEQYLRWLVDLLRPVTRRLAPLLAPWVERTGPLLGRWEAFFRGPEGDEFFTKRLGLNGMQCEHLEVALRYFPQSGGYVKALAPVGSACCLLGLCLNIGTAEKRPDCSFSEKENAALRLLANTDRVAMLQAMTDSAKTGQDLVRELGLHSGAVFRDLNNMIGAGLINREVIDGRNKYRTNTAAIRRLSQRMLQVLDDR